MMDNSSEQKYWDNRIAQQIRENNQELREIETKLRAAYVKKSVKLQLAEKEKQRLEEQIQQQIERKEFRERRKRETQEDKEKREQTRIEKIKYRDELEEQIVEKCRKRKRLYEEFLNEKIIFDEIMRRIQQEHIEEAQEKLFKSKCLREDIDQLIVEQNLWRNEQKRIEVEENEKIRQHILEQESKMLQIKEMERVQREKQHEIQIKMCNQLNEIEREKLEREEILIDLKFKELEEKQKQQERIQLEERIRKAIQTKYQLDEQRRENKMRRLQQEKNDREFRLEQLKLLAERDRLDMMTAERQRVKKAEHHKAVRQLLVDRETRRNQEIIEMIREHKNFMEMEKRRQEIFEEERRNLLEKYAKDLIGFFPNDLMKI